MRIDLKGLNDNKNGIGTKVELYAGTLYQKWEVAGASGYLGQNATSILAGLGAEQNAEVVRLLWPTGVPQDEINLAAKKAQPIAELDRRGSSCPVLFSWNGREYEFIADMIGPGVVGHWIAPGERDVPDPDEYLEGAGDEREGAQRHAELPLHGADGGNGVSRSGAVAGDRSSGGVRSFSE